jgi:biopolymer transport protein ExbD
MRSSMRIRRREHPAEDFQMAPLIDMVFLLLVFFMCVSSLSQAQRRVPVELPESMESRVPEDLSDRAAITLLAGGEIHVGGTAVTNRELGRQLRTAMAANPRLRLQVRAGRDVPFSEIRAVLRACAEAGAYEVIYATHQAD